MRAVNLRCNLCKGLTSACKRRSSALPPVVQPPPSSPSHDLETSAHAQGPVRGIGKVKRQRVPRSLPTDGAHAHARVAASTEGMGRAVEWQGAAQRRHGESGSLGALEQLLTMQSGFVDLTDWQGRLATWQLALRSHKLSAQGHRLPRTSSHARIVQAKSQLAKAAFAASSFE